jgi:hypothetical protein
LIDAQLKMIKKLIVFLQTIHHAKIFFQLKQTLNFKEVTFQIYLSDRIGLFCFPTD